MINIFVHDFKITYTDLGPKNKTEDFFCSIRVYYNFSSEDPGDGLENLDSFYVFAATPFGFAKYVERCQEKGLYDHICFFMHLILVNVKNEKEILEFIKSYLQSINGNSEEEVVNRAKEKFGVSDD